MLFSKKKRFSISDKLIKEDISTENGDILIKVNLRYPEIVCADKDPLSRNAVGFYKRIAEGFLHSVKQDMVKIASERKKNDGSFVPFSAVMRWTKTFENEDFLSFVIEFSVWDGKSSQSVERKTQVWERKFGTKCRSSYFFEPKKLKEEFANLYGEKTKFDKDLFALCEDGFEFYTKGENGYKTYRIPHSASEIEFVTCFERSV
jgi:hypothetical protein